MPLPAPRPPRPDDPTGSARTPPSWATQAAEAAPETTRVPDAADTPRQMPLFHADDLAPAPAPAPARPRRARLPARIKALLTAPLERTLPVAELVRAGRGGLPAPTWPDSFFDADTGS
jgi:hypothetical protein